jgi:hypothetical protein
MMQWNELKRIIGKWMRWHRFNQAVHWGLRGLALGLAAGVIVTLTQIPRHQINALEYIEWVFLCTQIGWILGFAGGFGWPVNERRLINWFDLIFNLQERVSTAVDVQRIVSRNLAGRDVLVNTWRDRQLNDTLEAARQVKPGKLNPFHWERSVLLLVYSLGFLIVVLWVIAQPQFQITENNRQATLYIKTEIGRMQKQVDDINQSSNLSQAQKDSLSAPLTDAINRLQTVTSPEQAIAVLNQTEEKFLSKSTPPNLKLAQTMLSLGQQLGRTNQSPFMEVGQALNRGDLAKAGQGLQAMDFNKLNTGQRQTAVNELNQAGQNLAFSNPQIGKELQAAAIAVKQGNYQAAQQFLQDAGKTMETTGNQIVESGISKRAATDLHQRQEVVSQAVSKPTPSRQGTALALQKTPAGANSGSPGGTNGTGALNSGSSESIYSPLQPDGLAQPGANGQPASPGNGVLSNGTAGESQVPYIDVLPSYSDAYHRALDNGDVPVYLQPVIRDYFSSLAP